MRPHHALHMLEGGASSSQTTSSLPKVQHVVFLSESCHVVVGQEHKGGETSLTPKVGNCQTYVFLFGDMVCCKLCHPCLGPCSVMAACMPLLKDRSFMRSRSQMTIQLGENMRELFFSNTNVRNIT